MLTYYKCTDCLTAMTVDGNLPAGAVCVCGGKLSLMGTVRKDGHVHDSYHATPCNTLCTDAAGPNCSCSCHGENHGIGVKADILIDRDLGRAIVRPVDPDTAGRIAGEYRAAVQAARDRFELLHGPDIRAVRDGTWLPRDRWEAVFYGDREIRAAASVKIHATRIKRLNSLFQAVTETARA